jgi:hypothetical protein
VPTPTDSITFGDEEVEPIVGTVRRSPYNQVIVFNESEAEPIVSDVLTFGDEEAEPIIGSARRSPYNQVIVFNESEAEPIVSDVLTFGDEEAESIIGSARRSPYNQVIVFNESEAEPIVVATSDVSAMNLSQRPSRRGAPREIHFPPYSWRPVRQPARRPLTPLAWTTGPENRPSWWPRATNGISFELQDAWLLPAPLGVQTELPLPQTQVLSWLQKHRQEIIAAERKFVVDRRAIAGAIAWEALENAKTASARGVGPGKVHVNADVAHEIEEAGYLPRRNSQERAALLRRPKDAILYIAAIMSAKAAIAEVFGFDMRMRPDLLTNEYVARSLSEWTTHLTEKPDLQLVAAEDMALWTQKHLRYLELGVGQSSLRP